MIKVGPWNYEREHTKFDVNFELKMLSEEVKEFYVALGEKSIVDMLDAIADTQFVYEGTKFKFGMLEFETTTELDKAEEGMVQLSNYVNHHFNIMQGVVQKLGVNKTIMAQAFNFVCVANDLKGSEKVDGKVVKGAKWIAPEKQIKTLLMASTSVEKEWIK